MEYISFSEPKPEPPVSLACRLQVEGNIRYKQLTSCKLTYEDNEADVIQTWVAVKTRREVVEVSEPEYVPTTRFKGVFA